MIVLRKVAGRFEAVRRVMRGVLKPRSPWSIASLAYAMTLCLLLLFPALLARWLLRRANHLAVPALLGVVLVNPFLGAAAGGGAAGFYRTITIDHTKLGSSDATNFAVLVSGTYSYLATVANAGKVQNANGYDVGFFSDSSLTVRLKHETERYVAATGEVVYWVKVPSVSHTVDTVIYMNYGDTSITTDQSDKHNVWDSSYSEVMHLTDGSSLSAVDSTAFGNDGTTVTATAGAGQMDGCAVFASGSSQFITTNNATSLDSTASWTISAWVKPTSSFADFRPIIVKGDGTVRNYNLDIEITSGKLRLYFTQGASVFRGFTANTGLTLNTWNYCVGTYDGSTMRIYLNGAADDSGGHSQSGASDTSSAGLLVGHVASTTNYMNGSIDEARMSKAIARGADWITAEYNNQNSPSTFYAVGTEVPV